jgi:transposase-like protein
VKRKVARSARLCSQGWWSKWESFWSLLKREVLGTYHNVSKKYLALYLAEFQYRFNNRDNKNIFFDVIAGC